jgi:hypothetical protein
MEQLMRKILFVAALMLFAASSVCGDIVSGLTGTGWNIAGLYDTSAANADKWTLTNNLGVTTAPAFTQPSLVYPGIDYVDGINLNASANGEHFEGEWKYSTSFQISKIVDDPITEMAHIAFQVFTSKDISRVLVNGNSVKFDAVKKDNSGWFEIVLSAGNSGFINADEFDTNVERTFTLDFVYDFSGSEQITALNFGLKFDPENSTVSSTAPEPATMLILGLGIAGLGLARRRR